VTVDGAVITFVVHGGQRFTLEVSEVLDLTGET
jgi:hypothetical protein